MFAATRTTLDLVISIVLMLLAAVAVGWVFWRTLKRSEDPARLIFKWVLTAVILGYMARYVLPDVASGGEAALVGIMQTVVIALVMAIIWRHSIAAMIAKPFAALYDGGNEEDVPKPFYSTARAKRMRGDFLGAKADIRAELERFPDDMEGQMMLAEIEAQDIHDLQAAEMIVQRFIQQKGHASGNIAYALNSMADWHLKFAQDRDAAQACFEKIIELLPESEWALRASQRIAHLGETDLLLGAEGRRTYKVQQMEGDAGLGGEVQSAPTEDPATMAAKYVEHLAAHPFDTEIRERLAQLYAEHYHRLDLAEAQLEQLIQYPNQPTKPVIRWLNMLADLQVKYGGTYEAARAALERIVNLDPEAAVARVAENRIQRLRLEFKGKEKSQAVSLGSYDDDLGLKDKPQG